MWLLALILASILAFSVLPLLRRHTLPASTLAPDTASQAAQDTAPRISPLAIPWLVVTPGRLDDGQVRVLHQAEMMYDEHP